MGDRRPSSREKMTRLQARPRGRLRDGGLLNELLRQDNDFNCVIVVDECDDESRINIWKQIKNVGPRVKLVTIYNDVEKTSGTTVYLDCPPLGEEQVIEILRAYAVPTSDGRRWSELCGGSPRVAHVIGWNLQNNPDDVLRPMDTVPLWERYIAGGDVPGSEKVEQRKLVLQYLSLFKRFGYGPEVVGEARLIAAEITRADPHITWARFQRIVAELRARKILQGETTLYITPKALHIKLWAEWFDVHGNGVDVTELRAKLSGKLLEWFDEMFKYAIESKAARRIVGKLLSEEGIFQRTNYLQNADGANFFLALTEADPPAALRCLQNTVGTWTREELLGFAEGRREVVWALERIAIWRELFPDAARLLLGLGEAENETWGNNASGVFAELFSNGHDRVAPTEAPPEERFPVLQEALASDSRERRLLGIKACDVALETQYFTRTSGAEYQGLRKEPKLWRPNTWGDLFDAYRRVWQLLVQHLDAPPNDELREAIKILMNRARGVGRYLNLLDMVIETLSQLANKAYVDKKQLFEAVYRILHYDGAEMSPDVRARWRALGDSFLGADFHSRLERYVGMDLLEDKVDDKGNSVDRVGPHIDALADEALRQPDLLQPELVWLATDNAKNGFRFGHSLAVKDPRFTLLDRLLDAQRNAAAKGSVYFISGYLRALSDAERGRWEALLDQLADDKTLRIFVPELTWRCGLTDRAALRVLSLAKEGAAAISQFQMFSFGSVVSALSEPVFHKWIEFLLENGSRLAVTIALELLDFYYGRGVSARPLPKQLTLELLTAPAFFTASDDRGASQMEDYHWSALGTRFAREYPDESLAVAEKFLEHFGEQGTIAAGFFSTTQSVIGEISKHRPGGLWRMATKFIGPPVDTRAYHVTRWLRGGELRQSEDKGVLSSVPLDDIWRWVDQDVDKRARYLASFVPKALFRRKSEACLAREVLARYGRRKDVRTELMANFASEGWSGPASLHYAERKRELLEFRKGETNENVRRWIDDYVGVLEREIEASRIREEREEF